jgi:hypothetical protein
VIDTEPLDVPSVRRCSALTAEPAARLGKTAAPKSAKAIASTTLLFPCQFPPKT